MGDRKQGRTWIVTLLIFSACAMPGAPGTVATPAPAPPTPEPSRTPTPEPTPAPIRDPEEAAHQLFFRWRDGHRPDPAGVSATPEAVAALFAEPYRPEASWEFFWCRSAAEQPYDFGGDYQCRWVGQYDYLFVEMILHGNPDTGFVVTSVRFIGD